MKIKRTLYLIHRWFGIAMCLMFFLWFASGIVMMYVEYPELTEHERLDSKPVLDISRIRIDPEEIVERQDAEIDQVRITSYLDRPIYQIGLIDAEFGFPGNLWVYADTGEPLADITSEAALEVASHYAANMQLNADPSHLGYIEMDQWTVYGGFNEHRPLHKVALNDSANTHVYISSNTGEVLRDASAWERGWNWVGSTIHWIYPMQLRRHGDLWVDVVIWVSMAGVVAVVSGTIVGFMRVRVKRRYKNGKVTPYSGFQKWHHLLGLGFTVFVTMFVVSGLFSMSPFGLFENRTSAAPQVQRYLGEGYSMNGFQTEIERLRQSPQADAVALKEIEWQMIQGEGVLIGKSENLRTTLSLDSEELERRITSAAVAMLPNAQLIEQTLLTEYDNYYYSTHNRYRPLPAWRMVFDDDERIWYYIDAHTGELLNRSTATDRVYRWLYNGLHSLDFRFLMNNRPLWDLVVIVLSIAGVIFSLTSVVIGWRRLMKTSLSKRTRNLFNKLKSAT